MNPSETAWAIEDVARELDLVVYALERQAPASEDDLRAERLRLRTQLERLRQQLEDLARRTAG